MSRAIFEKPLAEFAWSDFESVIFNGLEEDQTLEFKETRLQGRQCRLLAIGTEQGIL
jgi:hypothetical protein